MKFKILAYISLISLVSTAGFFYFLTINQLDFDERNVVNKKEVFHEERNEKQYTQSILVNMDRLVKDSNIFSDLLITLKTTSNFHETRLRLLFGLWIKFTSNQVRLFHNSNHIPCHVISVEPFVGHCRPVTRPHPVTRKIRRILRNELTD